MLTLAIGIGGTTAVFSLIDAVLVRPLPFRDPHQLVMVFEDNSKSGFPQDALAPSTYAMWASDNEVFESVAATTDVAAVLTGRGEPTRMEARRVTRSLFAVLGAEPLLGRVFTESEDRPGGAPVVVLSYGLWQRAFGGDAAVVGRDVILNNDRHVVVGVMPREFQFLESYVGVFEVAMTRKLPAGTARDGRRSNRRVTSRVANNGASLRPRMDASGNDPPQTLVESIREGRR